MGGGRAEDLGKRWVGGPGWPGYVAKQNTQPAVDSIRFPRQGASPNHAQGAIRCGCTGSRSAHLRSRPRLYGIRLRKFLACATDPPPIPRAPATRHAYYRQLRLLAEHCGRDPATITEEALRDYFLHVKTIKGWKPQDHPPPQIAPPPRLRPPLLRRAARTRCLRRSSRRCAPKTSIPSRRSPHARGDRAACPHPHSLRR